jgi:hypothetical protein
MNLIERLIKNIFGKKKKETVEISGKTIPQLIQETLEVNQKELKTNREEIKEIDLEVTPKMKATPKPTQKRKKPTKKPKQK